MHGGGYSSGSKGLEARPLLHRLAGRGWVCVSADDRLRPAATHPEHLIDLFHSSLVEAVIDGIEEFAAWVRSTRRTAPAAGRGRSPG